MLSTVELPSSLRKGESELKGMENQEKGKPLSASVEARKLSVHEKMKYLCLPVFHAWEGRSHPRCVTKEVVQLLGAN